VRGVEEGEVWSFRGIPYAAPPVGALRFRPPQPPTPWDGLRDATELGAVCPQSPYLSPDNTFGPGGGPRPYDEDCLTVDVWTPASATPASRLPVMVWIHGGGFIFGAGTTPHTVGPTFVREGVVLVTLDYRLHALGYLYLDGLFPGVEGSGNCGLLDQIAALRWVRDNIAAFGGDPTRIRVFGESAGAMSVGTMLGCPEAEGLFQRAITQSGAADHNRSAATARRVTRAFLEGVDVPEGDLAALQALPIEELGAVADAVAMLPAAEMAELLGDDDLIGKIPWRPVVDGVVLPRPAIDAVADGSAAGIDLIIGCTTEEQRLFAVGLPPELRGMFAPKVAQYFDGSGTSPGQVIEAYARRFPGLSDSDLVDAVETDVLFGLPAGRLADAQRAHHDRVWRFCFAQPSSHPDLGACHGIDIPYVFDTVDVQPSLAGAAPNHALASLIHRAWATFAETGDPNIDGLPEWPAHDPTTRPVLFFDEQVRVEHGHDDETRYLWKEVFGG
jgi:para-nitrobenzyl esterase